LSILKNKLSEFRASEKQSAKHALFHAAMRSKYHQAAAKPWLSVPPDATKPE
jgi:hypothetical protein